MHITIVVPDGQGGVKDYGDKLAEAFRAKHSVTVKALNKTDRNIFSSEDNSDELIFLQYSGYGYAKKGAPLWLLKEIRDQKSRGKLIGIFFHELYATGPPWRSAFWFSAVQRYVAIELAQLCDFWITNRDASEAWLKKYASSKPHAVLPVFSNVGELNSFKPRKLGSVVVFGSAALRVATYRAGGKRLFEWIHSEGFVLHDIGPPIADVEMLNAHHAHGVVIHGRLDQGKVSEILSNSSHGVIAYSADHISKSGVFAAYCAHGVCPILLANKYVASDGLEAGVHFISGIPNADDGSDGREFSLAAWGWYQSHRIEEHRNAVARLISDCDHRS